MPIQLDKPATAQEAVATALSLVGNGTYMLGTGNDYTPPEGEFDCAGFAICKCYNLKRHRPGFNRGAWASVSDDLNCNSAIEDAQHKQELFQVVDLSNDVPKPGDLLTYPTVRLTGRDGKPLTFIGHIAIVTGFALAWAPRSPLWADLEVVQCCGPNGRHPGILKTTAAHWDAHDQVWPKAAHRSILLRVKHE